MTPAIAPRAPLVERLLLVGHEIVEDARLADLPRLLRRGDLLVVNDAATLPASLAGTTSRAEPVELRLASGGGRDWTAVVFGTGDWRTATEKREPPPRLAPGDTLSFGPGLTARVTAVSSRTPRLVDVRFDRDGAGLVAALYVHGRPVQYSYLREPLSLWDVQTPFAARPWAVEMPSAGRPLTWGLLRALDAAGVALASLTHAAGLSSTGDAALDALLPLPERYDVPASTVAAVAAARGRGGRVIAVGTTVVRAVEANAVEHGRLTAGAGVARLRIGPDFERRVVDGLLTGIHEPGTSHFELLAAFLDREHLTRAFEHAERAGYLGHEFGDASLVMAA